jgi:hypothetical protein
MGSRKKPEDGELRRGLKSLLQQVEDWLEPPMIVNDRAVINLADIANCRVSLGLSSHT